MLKTTLDEVYPHWYSMTSVNPCVGVGERVKPGASWDAAAELGIVRVIFAFCGTQNAKITRKIPSSLCGPQRMQRSHQCRQSISLILHWCHVHLRAPVGNDAAFMWSITTLNPALTGRPQQLCAGHSLFTLRKARYSLRINKERVILRVYRLEMLQGLFLAGTGPTLSQHQTKFFFNYIQLGENRFELSGQRHYVGCPISVYMYS